MFQVGANAGNTISVALSSVSASGLGIKVQVKDWVLPLHPGVIKAYKEAGHWTDKDQAHTDKLLAHYAAWSAPAIHRRLSPFLNAFSGIGWTLLAVIWFGVSSATVVFTITIVLLPFALVNLREGLEALDRELLET